MSSSALMSIGTRAMTASYAALQATGNNIANANTAGYSRQQVELATAGGMYTGMGFFGRGVDVTTVSRMHDAFLVREAELTQSIAAGDSARLAQLEQLEQVFALKRRLFTNKPRLSRRQIVDRERPTRRRTSANRR